MNKEQEMRRFEELTDLMQNIFAKKREDYGPSTTETFNKFGPVAMLVRMHDKLARLDTLLGTNKHPVVDDERVEDTLLDLANYAVITILEMEKCFCSLKANIKKE